MMPLLLMSFPLEERFAALAVLAQNAAASGSDVVEPRVGGGSQ